mgnify:CR=1 FL=1
MKKLELDNKVVTIGKTSFNTENFVGMNKKEFMDIYSKVKIGYDLNDAWKILSKYTKVPKGK